jgi:hypothetical protein
VRFYPARGMRYESHLARRRTWWACASPALDSLLEGRPPSS